jgi:ABC-type multidrug transport system permease subunit
VTDPSNSHFPHARPKWHAFFSEAIRLALAPLILLFSGFFTANFIISGQYTWPRTSRAFALTLTILILSYEFVYKEQLARGATVDRAKRVLLHSCIIPYVIGVVIMVVLWKL